MGPFFKSWGIMFFSILFIFSQYTKMLFYVAAVILAITGSTTGVPLLEATTAVGTSALCYQLETDGIYTCVSSARHYCMIDYNSTKPCQEQIDNCFEACSPQELLCMGTYSACNNQHNHDLQACAGDTHCIAEAKQAYWNCRAEAMLSVYCTNLHDWCYNQFHCIIPCQKENAGCKFYFADCREEVRVMEMC